MEVTIDQALQQGVAAHKEGNLHNAERLYRAILQLQPDHPDANHNLGVLAVAVGKPLEALPLLRKALAANPKIEQFWLSYIDVLIGLERFDEAKRFLAEGEEYGVSFERLKHFDQRVQTIPSDGAKIRRQGLKVSEKRKRLAEKKKRKKRKTQTKSAVAAPSQDQLNRFREHYRSARLADAQKLAELLTRQFPEHPFGWKGLGAVLQKMGKLAESMQPKQKSVELSPQDAEAHNNLGTTLQELGRLAEAAASFRQAIALKPDYAEAYYNLGVTARNLGCSIEAEESYKKAIDLKPDFAEAHCNLGITLADLGRSGESISSYVRAINLNAEFDRAYFNLGLSLQSGRFYRADRSLYPILTDLLTKKNFVRPSAVADAILSLLRLDNVIEDVLLKTTASPDIKELDRAIKILDQFPLLHQLMRICPLPDLQLEALFVSMRRVFLAGREELEASPEILHFLSTLSLHCFINEYVYFETAEEAELVNALEAEIVKNIARASQPTITNTLIFATYRPLHQCDWSEKLRHMDQVPEVKARLLDEPLADKAAGENMPALSSVEDDVSCKVRAQYEQNPYPRWVQLSITPKSESISEFCNRAKLQLRSENIKDVSAPSILIAGCGTGQHSIEVASRFANCQITAIDLSRASLAYAQRKTRELGMTNIEYFQADILSLSELDQQFDIIGCTGVLHHMDDPMAGWQVLVGLLKTGGLMNIGLYSELARRPVVKTRVDIAARALGASASNIRKFRQSIIDSNDEHHQLLADFGDFFSLSGFRDLALHVQEHRFTLPQIQKCIDQLGLTFCGFTDQEIVKKFKHFFGEEPDACNLLLWQQFEEKLPHTFSNMYQFWCQKI